MAESDDRNVFDIAEELAIRDRTIDKLQAKLASLEGRIGSVDWPRMRELPRLLDKGQTAELVAEAQQALRLAGSELSYAQGEIDAARREHASLCAQVRWLGVEL